MRKAFAAIAVVLVFGVGPRARAGNVDLTFAKPDFEWHHPGNDASASRIWNAGDYWAQKFTGTGLASVDSLALHLEYSKDFDNTIVNALSMKVLLNGAEVGTFAINRGDKGYDHSFAFGAITGPDFRIQLEATNSTGFNGGSVTLDLGTSYVTLTGASVPEPSAVVLAGSALAAGGVVGLRRRGRARAV